MVSSFRFNASHALLTYSQCDLSKEYVRDALVSSCGNYIKRMVIGQEHHQDGNLHIHVAIKFTKKMNIRRSDYFDIGEFHPNIASRHTFAGAETYVKKEDHEPLEHGASSDQVSERLRDVCASMTDRIDWIEYCVEHRIAQGWGNDLWSLVHPDNTNTIHEWNGLGTIVSELDSYVKPTGNVLIIGPSGCGKSTWAKRESEKPALWVTHIDELRRYRPGYHKSIIFDDLSFQHLPVTSQIHIADWNDARSIHVRYGCAQIPAHTPKIFTCNSYPFSTDGEEGNAIKRRVRTVRLRGNGSIFIE